ncbi:hypothetical protein MLD38_016723 [Melastoma candidum]|uniref:Uncharacterized protein n=1 Tax=Melastoma candidum TaxID=119954 RepID=A0ACB9QNG9_9MYRT|nr:hypothetical protein MLD38_016723 [Melastoma candidum]
MKETIRCRILPCGALDVIHIVHTNGQVERDQRLVCRPRGKKHVLKKFSSPSPDWVVPRIAILPPDVELSHGNIYLLEPMPLAVHNVGERPVQVVRCSPEKEEGLQQNHRNQTTT